MNNKSVKYIDIMQDAYVFRGFPPGVMKEPDNPQNYEKLRILGFGQIKKMFEEQDIDDSSYHYFNLKYKQKKDFCFIEQYDLVIPLQSATPNLPILYIEKKPKDRVLYNTTNIVIRLKEKSPDLSKYLYIMLTTQPIQDLILNQAYRGKAAISYRFTVDIFYNLKIPIISKDKYNELLDNYTNIVKKEKELDEQKKMFNSMKNNYIKNIIK